MKKPVSLFVEDALDDSDLIKWISLVAVEEDGVYECGGPEPTEMVEDLEDYSSDGKHYNITEV